LLEYISNIRKISFIILLNDDFEGGELEFQFDEKRLIDFKKGDIIVFQSDIPHRVRPVTSGKRRSLVGWVQGPAYK
jgi:PKHD-type hydroxylase